MRSTIFVSALGVALAVFSTSDRAHAQPGIALTLGGGIEGFTDDDLAATAGDGAGWGVRLQVATRSPISVEAAYAGSAQTVDTFGLDNSALLVGTALEGGVRFSAFARLPLSPYVYVGAAWRRYDLTRFAANFSDVSATDNVLEIPVAAGAAYRLFGWVIDARIQYRHASGSDLVPESRGDQDDDLAMHRWGISGNLGYEF